MTQKTLDFVVIGLNVAKTIKTCLDSIIGQNYDSKKCKIIYVDGGSSDNTMSLVESYNDVTVLALNPEYPAPGMQRNAGWKYSNAEYIMFMDSDTILEKDFICKALSEFNPDIGAVYGNVEELYPHRSKYIFATSLNWNGPAGETDEFGGNVIIERKVLEETGGYDEILVGGEDPELALRVRKCGYRIIHIDIPMLKHDLAIYTAGKFLKRAYRTGYSYAAVSYIHRGVLLKQIFRIVVRGGGGVAMLVFSLASLLNNWFTLSLVFALLSIYLILRPRIMLVSRFMKEKNIGRSEAKTYTLYNSMCVIPEFFGFTRYYIGLLFNRPLRNKKPRLLAE